MRPGRYPEDHPLEQQARDELREKQGEKPEPIEDPKPRRWGAPDADPPVR